MRPQTLHTQIRATLSSKKLNNYNLDGLTKLLSLDPNLTDAEFLVQFRSLSIVRPFVKTNFHHFIETD